MMEEEVIKTKNYMKNKSPSNKLKKIILIKPKNDVNAKRVHYGLLCIGTILDREGYQVRIIDAEVEPTYKKIILKEIKDALLVGITALTTEVSNGIEISNLIKKHSKVPIVWGGCHATLYPKITCLDKSVDFVCINEGENTMLKLVKALETNRDFSNINGLVYKENDEVKINPQKEFVDLEKLPLVNFDLLNQSNYHGLSKKRTLTKYHHRFVYYQSSRGCPHRCKFCVNVATGNRIYRTKSAQKVVDEIEELVKKYDVQFIHFLDDNTFANIKRLREMCTEIIKRGLNIKWTGECRADYFRPNFVDKELLDLAEKSGLYSLTIGAESGSQRMLNLLNKDVTIEQILNSAKLLSERNITTGYSFIIGIPGEKKEDIIASIRLARKIKKIYPKAKCGMNIFTSYPKCELTNELIKKGWFEEPQTLKGWSDQKIRDIYTGRYSPKPWHKNPKFILNVSYFSHVAYHSFLKEQIINDIKRFYVWSYPNIFFMLLAKIRMKYLIFLGGKIDQFLYESLKKIQSKVLAILNRV